MASREFYRSKNNRKNLYLRLDLCFVKVINVLNRGVHYSIPVSIIYYIQHSVSASAQAFILYVISGKVNVRHLCFNTIIIY